MDDGPVQPASQPCGCIRKIGKTQQKTEKIKEDGRTVGASTLLQRQVPVTKIFHLQQGNKSDDSICLSTSNDSIHLWPMATD
jgi:hypothetical protein